MYTNISGIQFSRVNGTPVRKGVGRSSGKYQALIEEAATLSRGSFLKVTATNVKGARLAAAIRQAIRTYYKGSQEWRNFVVMTTEDGNVAIQRTNARR